MKGYIALDIDGTLTADKYSIPSPVISYLQSLNEEGWKIFLVTGRPLAYTSSALKPFGFPFILIAQNGSVAFQMPETSLIFKNYLDPSHFIEVERALEGTKTDFLIYAGFERGDICFYRPNRFQVKDQNYLVDLQIRQKEKWQAVSHFDPKTIGFIPLIKCFGPKEEMSIIANRLLQTNNFEVTQIQDPQYSHISILLITAHGVSKGFALTQILEEKGKEGILIAAGDDLNDRSMLLIADRKIVMPHAPLELLDMADLIAPPVEKMGIIKALQEVLEND